MHFAGGESRQRTQEEMNSPSCPLEIHVRILYPDPITSFTAFDPMSFCCFESDSSGVNPSSNRILVWFNVGQLIPTRDAEVSQ